MIEDCGIHKEELAWFLDETRKLIVETNELNTEGRALIAKLTKLLNAILIVVGIVFIPFIFSFVDVHVRLTKAEETKISKEEALATFPTKSAVIYLQNDVYDIRNYGFQYRNGVTEQEMEVMYTKALKKFNGDISRSAD